MKDTFLTSDEDGEGVVDALNRDGLLASVIEEDWRPKFIAVFAEWFAYSRELNRNVTGLFVRHWRAGEGGASSALHPTAGRALARCLNHYAAAVVLCERAFAIDAASAARSIFEAGFWLAYMASEPAKALSDLEVDDLKSFVARERELQRVSHDNAAVVTESKVRERDYIKKLDGRTPATIADIARRYGQRGGYLQYRILSGHFGHLSQASLRQNFRKTGENAGLNVIGPHEEEVPKALYFASVALLDAADSFATVMGDTGISSEMQEYRSNLERLPK